MLRQNRHLNGICQFDPRNTLSKRKAVDCKELGKEKVFISNQEIPQWKRVTGHQ